MREQMDEQMRVLRFVKAVENIRIQKERAAQQIIKRAEPSFYEARKIFDKRFVAVNVGTQTAFFVIRDDAINISFGDAVVNKTMRVEKPIG